MSKFPLFLSLVLVASCDLGGAPPPPAISLAAPVDTLEIPFSYLGEATWLGDGQWAVLAPNEHAAVIIDFAHDTFAVLGGPKHPEYSEPFVLFKAGDSLYLADWGKRAVTVWNKGSFARSIDIGQFVRGAFPEARDNAGRFYSKLPPAAGADGSGNRDSAVIIAMAGTTVDTIAGLSPPDIAEVFGDAGRRYEPRALSGSDEWGVLSDGTLWIARINQNRVDRRAPDGKWKRGEQLPDPVLPVQQEDRNAFLAQFPPDLRSTAEKVPFAIIKPPFTAAFASPDGDVWPVKNYAMVDTTRTIQRVGPDGKLKAQYVFPGYGKVIGANQEVILVAESTAKGHRVLVYRIPSPAPDQT